MKSMSYLKGKVHRKIFYFFLSVILGCQITAFAQFPHKLSATKEQVQSFFGTNKVKLVFVQKVGGISSIFFIDFTEATPQVRKLVNNTSNVSLPVISPDGNWVVYRVGEEEETEKCPLPASAKVMLTRLAAGSTPVEIANIGYSPRFDYRVTEANKIGIIYPNGFCNGAAGGDLPHQGGVKTVRKIVDVSGSTPSVGPEEVIYANGAYNAGISKDGKYLAVQYPGSKVLMLDLASTKLASVDTFAMKNVTTNKDTFMLTNVCNGSISSSSVRPDAVMMYTGGVGKKGYSTNYGTWGSHQRIVIRSFRGDVLRSIMTPALSYCKDSEQPNGECPAKGEIYFDASQGRASEWWNPEWSNHPYFATASLQTDRLFFQANSYEHKNRSEFIYGINIKESLNIRLIQSTDTTFGSVTDMVTPWLWVSTDGLVEDPNFLMTSIAAKSFSKVSKHNVKIDITNNFLSLDREFANVDLFNSLGQKIWSSTSVEKLTKSVKLPNVTKGVYFIKVKVDGVQSPVIYRWNLI